MSEGEFAESNFSSNVSDLLDASDFLAKEYQVPNMLIGHSLGGAAVLYAAAELSEVKAIVTIAAPAYPAHVRHLLEGSAVQEVGGIRFQNYLNLKPADESVAVEKMQELYEAGELELLSEINLENIKVEPLNN